MTERKYPEMSTKNSKSPEVLAEKSEKSRNLGPDHGSRGQNSKSNDIGSNFERSQNPSEKIIILPTSEINKGT